MLPFGGTFIAIALVGTDIKRKGVVKGVANSALDAVPVVGVVVKQRDPALEAIDDFLGDGGLAVAGAPGSGARSFS